MQGSRTLLIAAAQVYEELHRFWGHGLRHEVSSSPVHLVTDHYKQQTVKTPVGLMNPQMAVWKWTLVLERWRVLK